MADKQAILQQMSKTEAELAHTKQELAQVRAKAAASLANDSQLRAIMAKHMADMNAKDTKMEQLERALGLVKHPQRHPEIEVLCRRIGMLEAALNKALRYSMVRARMPRH